MNMLIYAVVSIIFLALVVYLLIGPRPIDSDESLAKGGCARTIANGSWLSLSERIFDPSDARWLANELAFPKLAKALMLSRKRLAIRWLEALQSSFDELVRTPSVASSESPGAFSARSWKLLWLTVRFKLLISYALLVVKVLGPYHRLIPSFSWVPFPRESKRSFQRAALAGGRNSS
jgi:hypothetical protein